MKPRSECAILHSGSNGVPARGSKPERNNFLSQFVGMTFGLLSCFILAVQCNSALAQSAGKIQYEKREVRIPMRDGITLHTTIYSPLEADLQYPILMQRTPYGCNPYGSESRSPVMYNPALVESGYIFVYQDLRSRSMSDGRPRFENMKPAYSLSDDKAVDEVTDAYDTIDWLLANIPNHNQRVGVYGSSYMGFTALMAGISQHPNLKAVLAAAPCIDTYFEDFSRNGLFTLAYAPILDWFGTEKFGRHPGPWWDNNLEYWADGKRFGLARDSYDHFLAAGGLSECNQLISRSNYLYQEIADHPNYDQYRQQRNVSQHLHRIQCPTLVVGSWHDEQNLYGTITAARTLLNGTASSSTQVLIGPWTHSDHRRREPSETRIGDIFFGKQLIADYQETVELPFFERHLKNESVTPKDGQRNPTRVFDTGTLKWHDNLWPLSKSSNHKTLFIGPKNQLLDVAPSAHRVAAFEFVSYPDKPVPYLEDDDFHLFPAKNFMTADQRFASKRPDVLTFVTPPLESALQVVGPVKAELLFATSESDADLFVKLIDVYPMNREPAASDRPGVKMNGYQRLVRCGQIRGRYRQSYSRPTQFEPETRTKVPVDLLDVCHTFARGHRIMVQIQSSLFPLFDRNPQQYVENVYLARAAEFKRASHQIFPGSRISLPISTAVLGATAK
ncbi:MAG: CocE/NonD family hydrolase [Aureliella sp.]